MHACDDTKTSLFYMYCAKNMKLQLLRVCRLQFLALFYRFIYRNTQITNKSKIFFKEINTHTLTETCAFENISIF